MVIQDLAEAAIAWNIKRDVGVGVSQCQKKAQVQASPPPWEVLKKRMLYDLYETPRRVLKGILYVYTQEHIHSMILEHLLYATH